MLFDPARHEKLLPIEWDENRVRAAIAHIAGNIEARYSEGPYWPSHPLDLEEGDDPDLPGTSLYCGACGVIWALHYLESVGATKLSRSYSRELESLVERNRAWLKSVGSREFGSYLTGDIPILMLAFGNTPTAELGDRIAALIADNVENPARDLMWGSPGTMLAALFLYERTRQERWADLFRRTAGKLWTQLQWSPEYGCHYWTQDVHGRESTYLDGVHGFVATALPIIRGRALLSAESFTAWEERIVNTVERTATWEGPLVNWRPELRVPKGPSKMLMQYCHGAPGFVVCLADLPGTALDRLLVAAGEATWTAGPLIKGSNLCHGTGGNGYAFLKLYRRTGDSAWLARARAFAMHGIVQTEAEEGRQRRLRYSLWTGDAGFAIYLWDCVHGSARFPTLDCFYAD
jgi:lantibiotic modifying enzyme